MNALTFFNKLKDDVQRQIDIYETDKTAVFCPKEVYQLVLNKQITEENHSLDQIDFGNVKLYVCWDNTIGKEKIKEFYEIFDYISNAYGKKPASSDSGGWLVLFSNYHPEDLTDKNAIERSAICGETMYRGDCIHLITTQSLGSDSDWTWRHELVHVADRILDVSQDYYHTSEIAPDDDDWSMDGVIDGYHYLELQWQRELKKNKIYCEKNKAEQMVVDVLSKKYDIPEHIMRPLAHGAYSSMAFHLKKMPHGFAGEGFSSREFKKVAKQFVKDQILPKNYPHYYKDIVNIFKNKNTWLV